MTRSSLRLPDAALLLFFVLLGAIMAGLSGQDAGFDLRNYHWYDGWAALHGRLDVDVAPAQLQTFFNPALDVFYHLLVTRLGADAGAIAVGGFHGLLPGLAALLGLRLLPPDLPQRRLLASACGALALSAPIFRAGVGTSQGDLLVGTLVLGGLLALLNAQDEDPTRGSLLWGLLTGVALGLKPTAVAFVVAGLPLVALRGGLPALLRAALGGFVGWGLGGGWWAVALWSRFANPFFPMMNDVFQSDWAAHDHFFDQGYFPNGADWVLLPLRFALGGEHSWFYEWRDARWLAMCLLGSAWLARRRDGRDLGHLLLWAGVAYLFWLRSSAMIRYLAPLEAAIPSLLVACAVGLARQRAVAFSFGLLVVLAAWQRAPDFERVPFSTPPLGIRLPPLPSGPNPVLVTSGDVPISYVAPSFPPEWTHVRTISSIVWHEDETGLAHRAAAILRSGDPVLLLTGQDGEFDESALPTYGLARSGPCQPVETDLDEGVLLCPTVRTETPSDSAQQSVEPGSGLLGPHRDFHGPGGAEGLPGIDPHERRTQGGLKPL